MAGKICERFQRFLKRVTSNRDKLCASNDSINDYDILAASTATDVAEIFESIRRIVQAKIRNCPNSMTRTNHIIDIFHQRAKTIIETHHLSRSDRQHEVDAEHAAVNFSSLKKSGTPTRISSSTDRSTYQQKKTYSPTLKIKKFADRVKQFADIHHILFNVPTAH